MSFSEEQNYRDADAKRLSVMIKRWQAVRKLSGLPSTLRDLGVMVGGISQSAVTQYATNKIPLNEAAVRLFASALGVTPEQISPSISERMLETVAKPLLGMAAAPGMVYTWHEAAQLISVSGHNILPAVFSLEIHGSMMGGFLRRGDIVVVSRSQSPSPGDGVMITRAADEGGRQLDAAVYWPGPAGASRYQLGHVIIDGDQADLLGAVVGMPNLRWTRLSKWCA
jgi:SOS-response transcriptional repressor LexA